MKNARRGLLAGGLALAFVGVPVAVHAGYSSQAQVSIYQSGSSGSAYGSLQGARNGTGTLQWISCTVYDSTSMSSPRGYCSARDNSGTVVSCGSNDWRMVEIMESVGPTSVISFNYNGSDCSYVSVSNTSYTLP